MDLMKVVCNDVDRMCVAQGSGLVVGYFKQGEKSSGSITAANFCLHEQLLTSQVEIFPSDNYLANLYAISYECVYTQYSRASIVYHIFPT
jgi:hypothetical protein